MTPPRIWLLYVLGAAKKPIGKYTHFTAASQVAENQQ
jgi:hypothetical protein